MNEGGFRGSVFGGFNRGDVAAYITSVSKQLNESKAEGLRLKEENAELNKKLEDLTARVSVLEAENEELKSQNESLSSEKAEAGTLKEAAEALRAELDANAKALSEYELIKDRLSLVEVEACKRAQEIEAAANQKYQRVMETIGGIITSLKTEYEEIRSGTEITAAHLCGEMNRMEKRIELVSSVLGKTADDFDELEKFIKTKSSESK